MGNPFTHVEIRCKSLVTSRRFYESAFDWKFSQGPPGERFSVVDTGGSVTGDLQEVSPGAPLGVTAFIAVDDINEALRRIEAHQGRMVMGRQEIPGGYGRWALFADPDGNVLALYEAPR